MITPLFGNQYSEDVVAGGYNSVFSRAKSHITAVLNRLNHLINLLIVVIELIVIIIDRYNRQYAQIVPQIKIFRIACCGWENLGPGCYVFIAEKFNVLFDRKRLERYFHLFTPVAELTM